MPPMSSVGIRELFDHYPLHGGKWRGFYNPGKQLSVQQSCIAPGLVLQYSSIKHRERGQVQPANGTSGLSRLSFVEENTCLSIATVTPPLGNIELSKM